MPIKLLSKYGVIVKKGDLIRLTTEKLTFEQKAELRRICEEKMLNYAASRGLSIWDYRLFGTEEVPDLLRFRVLKEARGHCELCGATKDESPLDIDHIIPRSRGGRTVYENLQALCVKCNRSKRDKDQTDFRGNLSSNFVRGCLFCEAVENREVLMENGFAFAILDRYPVSEGHTLVVTKRHVADYFEKSEIERSAANDLLRVRRKQLLESDPSIEGFNVGVNCGEAAGQTIFHCHIHLIPRRLGDTPHPEGGVRGVIPNKMSHKYVLI